MTILDEGRLLRAEAAKLRPDRRRRYPVELRLRLLSWFNRAVAAGVTEAECGHAIGIRVSRFRRWRAAHPEKPLALVPIKVTHVSAVGGLALVAPTGHRIEGLTLEQAVVLLRELA